MRSSGSCRLVDEVSGYFETLPSRDSTTSYRLVTSRLFILDTSRLCSGHLETIGHFETVCILDTSRLCPGHFETFRKKTISLMYYETKTVMVGAKKLQMKSHKTIISLYYYQRKREYVRSNSIKSINAT